MKTLDAKTLKTFLKLAGDTLTGQWILVGGTVLPLLGINHRVTTDVDLVGMSPMEQAQILKLMEIAEKLNLPVESINQAGGYFLFKIKDFEKHLILLHRGKSAIIYRPDVTLFLLLKIARLTESDFQDCIEFLKLASKTKEPLDQKKIISAIQKEIKSCASPDRLERLNKLITVLT